MKILKRTLSDLLQPGIELASFALTYHEGKVLGKLVSQVHFFMDLTELFKQLMLLFGQLARLAKKEPRRFACGERETQVFFFDNRSALPLLFFRKQPEKNMSHGLITAPVASFLQFFVDL